MFATDDIPHPIIVCTYGGGETANLKVNGMTFPDPDVAAAMIDRIVHHADVLTLKGASYRLRGRGVDSLPSVRIATDDNQT